MKVSLFKDPKFIKIGYDNLNFGEGNSYIKFLGISVVMHYDKLSNVIIHVFHKKSKAYTSISFNEKEIKNQNIINWYIIKTIYSCPMSIKKLMNQNDYLIKKTLEQSKNDFKPYLIKMYGY